MCPGTCGLRCRGASGAGARPGTDPRGRLGRPIPGDNRDHEAGSDAHCLHGVGRRQAAESDRGTAFFLTPDGEFMTAAHVIADVLRGSLSTGTEGCASPVVYLPLNEWPSGSNEFTARWYLFDAAKCVQDSGLDLAFCRTRQNPSEDLQRTIGTVAFAHGLQVDGTAVAFTGFPLNVIQPMTARGHIAMYTSRNELIVDQSAWPGVSGCPVYLVDGSVIGVLIQRGTGDGTGRSIVRTTAEIDAFLVRARTTWGKNE